jgi:glycine hydroxymethyltransferase
MENNIRVSKSLLPWDDTKKSKNPSGIRIGATWGARHRMKEKEMLLLADLTYSCIVKGMNVKDEVGKLRREFPDIHYSYDGRTLPVAKYL